MMSKSKKVWLNLKQRSIQRNRTAYNIRLDGLYSQIYGDRIYNIWIYIKLILLRIDHNIIYSSLDFIKSTKYISVYCM